MVSSNVEAMAWRTKGLLFCTSRAVVGKTHVVEVTEDDLGRCNLGHRAVIRGKPALMVLSMAFVIFTRSRRDDAAA